MSIILNGTTGITTPDVTADGLTVDSTTLVVNEANNRVGIGTSSPSALLDLEGATATQHINATTGNANTLYQLNGTTTASIEVGGGNNFFLTNNNASGNIYFRTGAGAPTRATIDSSGRFCINNTETIDNSSLSIKMGSDQNAVSIRSYDSSTSVMMMQFYTLANSRIGFIQTVAGSSTTYSTSSDYRLKENIAPMTGALAKVAQLKPATYKWKSNGLDSQGFIAHELAEVVPECVTGTKDEMDADGNPVYQGIDTSFLVATLTAAIQELKAIVDAQAQTIESLTARVVALEGQP